MHASYTLEKAVEKIVETDAPEDLLALQQLLMLNEPAFSIKDLARLLGAIGEKLDLLYERD